MAQKPLTYKQKSGIAFIEQDDPPFIKAMKMKMGYKEPPKLEDKVVVLNPETDLSKEEMNKELAVKQKEEDDRKIAEGKITFKKPIKRSSETDGEMKEKKKRCDEVKQLNSRLLSFGDDEDEDE
ncbi:unnamed protein product [Nippostrongylus brasiliensis]|uniref:DUF4604 domain-containing protein n=1 Tax=Nippostrongylus brasiliensis TaxID=27835 RepID=A0A0N4XI98_NIPBR|nr:unnamed protein product [Nippostrongylus brasiliensis]